MRKPRLNSAVATVAVETVFSLLRVASLSFVILFSLSWSSFRSARVSERIRNLEVPGSRFACPGTTDGSHRPVRLHIERVDRVAARHIEAVVLPAAEGEVGAALRQADVRERLAGRAEHHDAVELFRLALELEYFSAADIRRLRLQRAIGAPAAPQIAVAIDAKTVERALIRGVDQLGLAAHRAVVVDVKAPDAAVRRALPFHDIELLLVRRESDPVGIDDVGNDGRQLAVLGQAIDVGGRLLGLFLLAFPLAVDAEQGIGEPDGVVGLDHNIIGRVQPLALELVGQHRDLAVLDRKSTRLNSSHTVISYAVFCLKKKKKQIISY